MSKSARTSPNQSGGSSNKTEQLPGVVDLAPPASGSRRRSHGDVLPRRQFLEQVRVEKRRADRSRAPLSLVVMRFPTESAFDTNDLRDIVTDLSLSTRETDLLGQLGDGLIGFLLPYSDAEATSVFSKLVIDRIEAPEVAIESATYPDLQFDTLLQDSIDGGQLTAAHVHHAVRKSRVSLALKRMQDIVGAIALLAALSPLMLVTALAVKLTSPGPIVFRQIRIGRGGNPFTFYKFRSMRTDGDDQVHRDYVAKLIAGQHHEINQGDAQKPVYKMKADPRITTVGRFIRKTSIDELPQLINVLKGEMSLVGPRPPVPYETEKYQSWHMRRLQEVRPGLTGLWQVEGRSKTTFDEMVRLDLRYIRNWSLWLDIKIIFKTIAVVFRMDGAD